MAVRAAVTLRTCFRCSRFVLTRRFVAMWTFHHYAILALPFGHSQNRNGQVVLICFSNQGRFPLFMLRGWNSYESDALRQEFFERLHSYHFHLVDSTP